MASSTDPKSDQEYGKGAPPPPQPRPDAPAVVNYFAVDVALRVLLFAAAVTGVVVIVTSDQTKWVPSINGGINGFGYRKAKFNHSPAFIYYVVAMSIAGLYALITILASISVLFKPSFQTKLLLHLAFLDVGIYDEMNTWTNQISKRSLAKAMLLNESKTRFRIVLGPNCH